LRPFAVGTSERIACGSWLGPKFSKMMAGILTESRMREICLSSSMSRDRNSTKRNLIEVAP
jgi:hypothetical protein